MRRGAAAIAEARGSSPRPNAGIGDRHREVGPERLAQREREREPGKAGAGDQHVRRRSDVDSAQPDLFIAPGISSHDRSIIV